MVRLKKPSQHASKAEQDDSRAASLASLSRTLEDLEARLSKFSPPAREPLPPTKTEGGRTAEIAAAVPKGDAPAATPGTPSSSRKAPGSRSSLADAVSEIVMRRRASEQAAKGEAPAPAAAKAGESDEAAREEGAPLDSKFRDLAAKVEDLSSEGAELSRVSEVAGELERLSREMHAPPVSRFQRQFDAVRSSFEALRRMIAEHESADAIIAEIEAVGEGLDRLAGDGADGTALEALRDELEELHALVARTAREGNLVFLGRGEPQSRPSARQKPDGQPPRDIQAELERLHQSLRAIGGDDKLRAVEERWETFEAETAPDAAASGKLREELDEMRQKLESLVGEGPLKALEARMIALDERFSEGKIEDGIRRLGDRMADVEASLARLPETLPLAALEARIESLAENVETVFRRQDELDMEQFGAIEERLDEISRALVATARQQAAALDMAPVERIEARVAALTARVDRLAEGEESEALSRRIGELAERIEALAEDHSTDAIAERMDRFAERLDALYAREDEARVGVLEAKLADLSTRLDETAVPLVDGAIVRSLEAQIARLSEHLTNFDPQRPGEVDPEIGARLAVIEQRLEEDRETVMAAARAAADEAVLKMMEAGERRESEHVASLSEELRALETLSRETDRRATEIFEAVHSTLLKIVDRLDLIENDIVRADAARPAERTPAAPAPAEAVAPAVALVAGAEEPQGGLRALFSRFSREPAEVGTAPTAAAAVMLAPEVETVKAETPERGVVDAPSLDASDVINAEEANRPLEPGSGAPDIAALLESVRSQQRMESAGQSESSGKSDFIAAARRAAMAAAAEAENLRSEHDDGDRADGKLSLAEVISRRRKPILMAVGAVLLALMAMPLGRAFLAHGSSDGEDAPNLQGAALPQAAPMHLTTPAAKAPVNPAAPAPAAPSAASVAPSGASPSAAPEPAKPTPPPAPTSGDAALKAPESSAPVAVQSSAAAAAPAAGEATAETASPAPAPASAAPVPATATSEAPATAAAETPANTNSIGKPAPSATTASVAGADAKAVPGGGPASAATKLAAALAPLPAVPAGIGPEALTKAAEKADPKALFEVGLRLMEGRSGEPKPKEAIDWFKQSASRGFAPAQYSLGTLYEKGNGVARDTSAARDWYTLAADQGNVRAMHNLAVLYATGIDGKSDPATAATWFKTAAEYGMRDSQYNLGILYARGAGVDQDLVKSYRWFDIVGKTGDADAIAKRDEIAKSLTPAQLEAAKAEVAAWKPAPRNEAANTVDIPPEWTAKGDHTASIDMKRAVRNIQAILVKLGYDAGTPDGVVGDKTTEAIRHFQKDAGLQATGAIDETLIRALLERKDS